MRFSRPDELGDPGGQSHGRDGVPLDVEASYEDFDDLWAPFPTGVGPAGAYAASLDPDAQEQLRDEFDGGSATRKARSRSRPAPGAPSGRHPDLRD